jgi:hypothetical protein
VSSGDTKHQIEVAVAQFVESVPALAQLKLAAKLELRAHGDHAPVWRVEVPGPTVSKEPPADARLEITMNRQDFNELSKENDLNAWHDAYDTGRVQVTGEPGIVKLLGNVIERRLQRTQA